jgi:small-conductance mechanosensitive channel
MEFLNQEYFGNSILKYIIFIGVLIACFVVIRIIGRMITKAIASRNERADSAYGELVISAVRQYLLPIAYFAAFYFCTNMLTLGDALSSVVAKVSMLFGIVMGAVFLSSIAVYFFGKMKRGKDESGALAIKWLTSIAKILIWSIALILFLDNLGVKITSLVTGLGIGGIAIAFAAQSVLTDIFCFFTIFFDKPFELGDFIVAGERMGTVEYIGVKTTRLRALNGEQLIFSNADLTSSRIRNYKTMQQRRVVFTLGVTYDTPYGKLREIPDLLKSIIESVEGVTFGRAHFSSYAAYSLDFEVVYYVLSSDYDQYMDLNQQINFKIKEAFERLGVEFAFPTQSIQLSSPANAPGKQS